VVSAQNLKLIRLFLLSVFLLYFEILLIRWISTEIRIFAYFKNLTLIACFFGIGLGCLITLRRHVAVFITFPLTAIFCGFIILPEFFGFKLFSNITEFLGQFNEMTTWSWLSAAPSNSHFFKQLGSLLLLIFMFFFISILFVPGGSLLGRLFNECPNRLTAYSVNIAGSIVGIWCFSIISYLLMPPYVWFIVALAIGCLLLQAKRDFIVAICSILAIMAIFYLSQKNVNNTTWSSYQKLTFIPRPIVKDGKQLDGGFSLYVNGTGYQHAANLDREFLQKNISLWPEAVNMDYISYDLAYRFLPAHKNILIVGSGTGNDVAAALRHGAQTVDAIEIDPVILGFGRQFHPERPYDDPRVTVHIDDARSFLKKTSKKYDLIVFGHLDSHILTSSFSNIRIDDYVYTVESFKEVKNLLSNNGIMWVVFAVERPFIGLRIFKMLEEAFGYSPIVFINKAIDRFFGAGGGITFITDKAGKIVDRLKDDPKLNETVLSNRIYIRGAVDLGTDDWPYLYLERKTIPNLYLIVILAILIPIFLAAKPFFGELRRINLFYFFLGAAFLLVEVQSISKMALLFGTTWIVNSIVITGILVMILIANLIALKINIRSLYPLYFALFCSLVLNLLFPFNTLLTLTPLARGIVASSGMCLPILFAGLVFIVTFKREKYPNIALASNLLGAIVGGFFESLSFVFGINSLGWVAFSFYGLSLLYLRFFHRELTMLRLL